MNLLTLSSQIDKYLRNLEPALGKNLFKLGKYSLSINDLIVIVVIYLITKIFLFIVHKLLNIRLGKKADSGRASSAYLLIRYIAWIVAIVLMLDTIGIKVTILLAGSAALLVGLGLGLQQIFRDIVSGIFILMERNIRIGDVMEFGQQVGIVKKIGLRTSTLYTREGINIIVPNHKFIVEDVINWSSGRVETKFKVSVGVGYDSDPKMVENILLEIARANPAVLKDTKVTSPFVRLVDFGESALIFELNFWSYDIFTAEGIKSDIRIQILEQFRKNNIDIPYPRRDIRITNRPADDSTEKSI